MPEHRLPRIAWKASCKPQKTKKSKILASGWMRDNEKWFNRWEAKPLLRRPDNDHMAITSFLQRQLLKKWEEKGSTRYHQYAKVTNPGLMTQYYKAKQDRPAAYLLEPVGISAQRKVASIRTGSHNLRSETGKWTPDDPLATICPFCEEGEVETTEHALLTCKAFLDIRLNFPGIKYKDNLADILRQEKKTTMLATFIGTIMKERQRLLNHL